MSRSDATGETSVDTRDTGQDRTLEMVLLGGFGVSIGEVAVPDSAWRLSKARDLVKMLALAPGRQLQRDQVLELLWPERDPYSAGNNLHQVTYAARKAIGLAGGDGHASIRVSDDVISLGPEEGVRVDVDIFESAARAALGDHDRVSYQNALDLYTGELLPDDRYEEWSLERRDVVRRLSLDLMSGLAHLLEADGELTAAADLLRRLLMEDPANEAAHRQLMRVYALAGDRSAAARQFETMEKALFDELGVAPDESSLELADDIATGRLEPAAAKPDTRSQRSNLGAPLSSFVGRERELVEIPRLVQATRIVTLVGAGGCGKTRLAIEVGRQLLEDYEDGVLLVELAPVTEGEEVTLETARTMGVRRGRDQTEFEAVASRIGDSEVLLILDNCEHVAAEAAELAAGLLAECPRLTILATSRERLRVPGEVVRRVSSLSVPDPDDLPPLDELIAYDSVKLFADRARAVQVRFDVDDDNAHSVAEVCFRLDGMPLALELAAARVSALSVSTIAANLDDRFGLLTGGSRTSLSRQRTLQATVEWSYELLEPAEQTLFRRLSVFHGSFDLDAAQRVSVDGLNPTEVAPRLAELVERSMVVAHDSASSVRYRLLETMREYGMGQLRGADELQSARTSHARWLLDLVRRGDRQYGGWHRMDVMSRVARAHDDIRPALDHLISHDPDAAVRLVSLLWPYWLWHAHLGEGLALIERALATSSGPSLERAEALLGAGALLVRWEGFEAMAEYVDRSLQDARALNDREAVCRALLFAGVGPWCFDHLDDAEALFTDTLAMARSIDNPSLEVAASLALAMAAAARHRPNEARSLLEDARGLLSGIDETEPILNLYTLGAWAPVRRQRETPLMWIETFVVFEEASGLSAMATVLAAMANLEKLIGRFERGEQLLNEALELFVANDDHAGEALAHFRLGQLALLAGDLEEAEQRLLESLEKREAIGHVRGSAVSLLALVRVATERGEFELASRYLDRAEQLSRDRLDLTVQGLVILERGLLDLALGNPEASVSLLAESLRISASRGYGLHAACVQRDLGVAQAAAGQAEDAKNTLSEASAMFEKHGHEEEVARCRRLLATVDD